MTTTPSYNYQHFEATDYPYTEFKGPHAGEPDVVFSDVTSPTSKD